VVVEAAKMPCGPISPRVGALDPWSSAFGLVNGAEACQRISRIPPLMPRTVMTAEFAVLGGGGERSLAELLVGKRFEREQWLLELEGIIKARRALFEEEREKIEGQIREQQEKRNRDVERLQNLVPTIDKAEGKAWVATAVGLIIALEASIANALAKLAEFPIIIAHALSAAICGAVALGAFSLVKFAQNKHLKIAEKIRRRAESSIELLNLKIEQMKIAYSVLAAVDVIMALFNNGWEGWVRDNYGQNGEFEKRRSEGEESLRLYLKQREWNHLQRILTEEPN